MMKYLVLRQQIDEVLWGPGGVQSRIDCYRQLCRQDHGMAGSKSPISSPSMTRPMRQRCPSGSRRIPKSVSPKRVTAARVDPTRFCQRWPPIELRRAADLRRVPDQGPYPRPEDVPDRRLRRAAFSLLTAGFAASPLLRDSEP